MVAFKNSVAKFATRIASVSRKIGSHYGRYGLWEVDRNSEDGEADERETIQERSEDSVANLWPASGKTETMTANIVGTGFRPSVKISHKDIGCTPEEAKELSRQMEKEWRIWERQAHVSGAATFLDIVSLNSHSLLTFGEFITLPVILNKSPHRRYQTALQDVHSLRLRTPHGMEMESNISDGIKFAGHGEPISYFLFDSPSNESGWEGRFALDYVERSANVLHRPNVLHGFIKKTPEQVRGISPLAPILKLCKQLDKSIDLSILAQHMQASIPVFIKTDNPNALAQAHVDKAEEAQGKKKKKKRYKKVEAGKVYYGDENQDIKMLDNKYPAANFNTFCETVLRGIAAASGMPYEIVTKDFSKTNYSSARAALQEAWRIFKRYRRFLFDHFCTPVFRLVMEEAVMTGRIVLPEGCKPFLQNIDEYCAVTWIGDPQGYINPLQEVKAKIEGIKGGVYTFKGVWRELGLDEDEMRENLEDEKDLHDRIFQKVQSYPSQNQQGADKPEKKDGDNE